MSGNRKFQVVEFHDCLQVVPISWLTSDFKKCSFPSNVNNEAQCNKLVAKMVSPKTTWQLWDVIKIIGSSDNFEKAYEKLCDSVHYNLSEVHTENEDTQKSQRKRRAKKILTSSEDELESPNKLYHYPTPPKRKLCSSLKLSNSVKKLSPAKKRTTFTLSNSSDNQALSTWTSKSLPIQNTKGAIFNAQLKPPGLTYKFTTKPSAKGGEQFCQESSSPKNQVPGGSLNQCLSDQNIDEDEFIIHSPNELGQNSDFLSNTAKSHSDDELLEENYSTKRKSWLSETLKHILRSNAHLKMQNNLILENQKEILVKLSDVQTNEPVSPQFSEEFSEYFPLSNDKDKILEVEEKLLDNNFKMNFVKRLKTFGGIDISHFIKVCLENLFSYELATKMSFTGKSFSKNSGSKMALNKLKLFKVMCDVGRDRYQHYTDDIVQKSVTGWLRHSTDRLDRHIKQQNCNDEMINNLV